MENNVCEQCALRMFNEKCYNLKGTGNWLNGAFIIISNIDSNAYKHKDIDFSEQIKVMDEISTFSTGGEKITEICYCTPLIKCREINYKADESSITNCIKHLSKEFIDFQPIFIMVTGSAVDRFLHTTIHNNLNKIFLTKRNRFYFVNYSPFIVERDVEKFDLFKQQLIKFINVIKTKSINDYEVIQI